MPTISIDFSFLNQIANANDPLTAAWLIFKAGGWIPFVVVIWKGLTWAWLEERSGIFVSKQQKVFLAIDIPKNNEQLPRAVENIFAHLQGAYSTPTKKEKWIDGKFGPVFSFEIISIGGYIQFVIMTWEKYRDTIEALIYSQYPEAEITEIEDYTQFAPQTWPNKTHLMFATEFVTKKPAFYPIKTYSDFEDKIAGEFKDPMASLLESMSKLLPEEQVWIQFLVQLENQDWVKGGEKLVKKLIGGKAPAAKPTLLDRAIEAPLATLNIAADAIAGQAATPKKEEKAARSEMLFLSPGEKTVVEAVERKLTKIGHKCKIRFIYIAPFAIARTSTVISFVRGALLQFTSQDLNAFAFNGLLTTKRDYFWQTNGLWYYLSATLYRTVNERMKINFRGFKNRSLWTGGKTFVLNTEELATVWHFPVMTVKAPLVKKTEAKRAEPPVGLPTSQVIPLRFNKAAAAAKTAAPAELPAEENAEPENPPTNLPVG